MASAASPQDGPTELPTELPTPQDREDGDPSFPSGTSSSMPPSLNTSGPPPPVSKDGPPSASPGSARPQNSEAVNNVLNSEIGISVLLSRLKQSTSAARDFAAFLGKRARLEEKHSTSIADVAKEERASIRRSEVRQGTFARQMEAMLGMHDRMAAHGQTFASSLTQMHEELNGRVADMERERKRWKDDAAKSEKRVKDAELAMDKAKAKYDTLANDYDRARTGDRSSGKVFTVKGPKSAEKHEDELLKKVQGADSDYATKVDAARGQRQEYNSSYKPQAIRQLQELVRECDSMLTLQMQKFAKINEQLVVANGMEMSPIKSENSTSKPGMRELAQSVDNDRDFNDYVLGHSGSVPPPQAEIKYTKHPTLGASQPNASLSQQNLNRQSFQQSPQSAHPAQSFPSNQSYISSLPVSESFASQMKQPSPSGPPPSSSLPPQPPQPPQSSYPPQAPPGPYQTSQGASLHSHAPSLSQGQLSQPQSQAYPPQQPATPTGAGPGWGRQESQDRSWRGRPYHQQQQSGTMNGPYNTPPGSSGGSYSQRQPQQGYSPGGPNGAIPSTLPPPSNPVFGINLDALFRRDELAVPMVVVQCIQAVDLFGLEVEGIYRLSGNNQHINQLRAMFDNDSSRVDFGNPENFHHDVNSVAGLLKQFFRDLPDPLFTLEHYGELMEAAKINDENARRDSIHAVINALPDPNYATIRTLVLHLDRVQRRAQINRMSTHNLAICFAPTLMGQHAGPMADASLQARVVDTILQNTFNIFDED